jgi:phospholipid/cholesterol/gamma-HCH transport system substrate-binding protein
MSESRLQTKVGLFVFVGLVLLAALLLLFSKGTTFQGPAYLLKLKSGNVGGIKAGANVLVSGVPVGRVSRVELDADGKSVTIFLKILQKYRIYRSARFEIEQFGFLGDQYIAIYPGANQEGQLKDGDEVQCAVPFNMQEAVAKAAETLAHIGQAATNLNEAVSDVRRFVLTQQTLTNLAGAVDKFAMLSTDALNAVSNVNALVASNALPVTVAVSNLNFFSGELTPLAAHVNTLVTNNTVELTAAIKNIETASGSLTNLLHELQTGDGLAGRLLSDPELAASFSRIVNNLSVTSSNLNRLGLWGIMWKHKEPRTNGLSPAYLRAPHDLFH